MDETVDGSLDVAAELSFLSERFGRIVLIGNSGGASLYDFYNQQSLLVPPAWLARTLDVVVPAAARPTLDTVADMVADNACAALHRTGPIKDGATIASLRERSARTWRRSRRCRARQPLRTR